MIKKISYSEWLMWDGDSDVEISELRDNLKTIIEKLNERLDLDSCWLRVYWEGEEMVVCLLRELSRFYGIEIKIKKSYLPVD